MLASTPDAADRRGFLRASAGSILLMKPETVFGSQANSQVEFGLVGSGNRGSWIAPLFIEHTGARLVALADVVRANLEKARATFKVDPARTYYGPDAYRELAASKLDAVVIETPPYFHPEHARAAVASGKHVYLAKPVAVDVPGCRMILETAKQAASKNLSYWVDFQMRAQQAFQEGAARVHRGDIGNPIFGQAYFHSGRGLTRNYTDVEPELNRLKNFYADRVLGGDTLVEQGIHSIDAINWYMNGHPVKAFGTGGLADWRGTIRDVGRIGWDHFAVTFWYPNGAHVLCSEAQLAPNTGGICAHCFGIKGTLESQYGGPVRILGENSWTGEKENTMERGTTNNIKMFIASLREGKPVNNAESAVESTLTAILGREAAYVERILTWEELLKSNKRLEASLKLRY